MQCCQAAFFTFSKFAFLENLVSPPCALELLEFFSSFFQETELIFKGSNSVISRMSQ